MDTVKVKYSGPNSKEDPRELDVSEQEAVELVKTGLYKKVASKKSSDDKKESDK